VPTAATVTATADGTSAVPTRTAMRADATMPGESAAMMPAEAVPREPAMHEAAVMTEAVVAMKVAVLRNEHDSAVRVVVIVAVVVGIVADGLRRARRHGQTGTERQ
jgi:hypothetical protein